MADDHLHADPDGGRFDHLDAAGRVAAAMAVRPLIPVFMLVAAVTVSAWWFLAAMAGSSAALVEAGALGPGMELIARYLPVDPTSYAARLADICLSVGNGFASTGTITGSFAVLLAMWAAMSAAMMLPSAAPMIRTYAEISDTAAARGLATVHVLVLVAGYLTVWLLAAFLFAGAQLALARLTGASLASPAGNAVAGLVLTGAGLYQFTPLKKACLEKCRNPFTVLFSRWKRTIGGVFRFGVEQGLYCLGCCWALMLVMFAAGTMNIMWMVALTLFAFIEKTASGPVTSRLGGTIVTAWGAALLAGNLIA